jgi:tol-pal system protein YbgF
MRAASLLAAAWLLLAGANAQAGLFDDDEARKAILELRARMTQIEEQAKARNGELAASNAQLMEQIIALRRSLLDFNNLLEAQRTEIAKLRGSDEQMARDLSEVQKRQKDVGQVVDDRLRKLEPLKVTLDGRDFFVDTDEKRAHDDAMGVLRGGDFNGAVNALTTFQRRYPSSPYGESVRFWLGNALYGKRDYKEAIAAFRNFVSSAPQHPRAPEAMLALANSQAETKDPRGARKTIEDLMKTYPQSEAAQAGKERLASIR